MTEYFIVTFVSLIVALASILACLPFLIEDLKYKKQMKKELLLKDG